MVVRNLVGSKVRFFVVAITGVMAASFELRESRTTAGGLELFMKMKQKKRREQHAAAKPQRSVNNVSSFHILRQESIEVFFFRIRYYLHPSVGDQQLLLRRSGPLIPNLKIIHEL